MSLIPFSYWKTQSDIVTDQLILHLDAGNTASYPGTGSTWTDLTGNSNATINASAGFVSSFGGYIDFNADSTHYADVTLSGVDTTTPTLTIEFWVRMTSNLPTAGMMFGFNSYDVFVNNNGLGFNTFNGDIYGLDPVNRSNADVFGEWRQIVFVMQQTTAYSNNKIYIDGVPCSIYQTAGSENTGNRSFSNGALRLNNYRGGTAYPWIQDLAIVRVYKKELTHSDIVQNYRINYTRFSKKAYEDLPWQNMRLYFNFQEEFKWYVDSGSYVRDFSPSKYYGTMSGGTNWISASGVGAMNFNGTNRVINSSRNANDVGIYYGNWSICYVFRVADTTGNKFVFGTTSTPEAQVTVESGAVGNKIRYTHNTASPPEYSTISANTWYHVICTYDYNSYTPKIYINGVLQVTGFQERNIGNFTLVLGQAGSNYYAFDLGLAIVWSRVISSTEVTQVFDEHKSRFGL